ncbi:MAG: YbgA family protein, partial [Nitrosopumilaceae archaeon]|nr:YbgA family protein [Nitrosopumilaceae archaeon]
HSQFELKFLGNLVANHNKNYLKDVLSQYESHLRSALKQEPTANTHLNVILHIFGYFARHFNRMEKDEFMEILRQYKEENIPIGEILTKIEPIIYKFNNTYLASQTYFLLYAHIQSKRTFVL